MFKPNYKAEYIYCGNSESQCANEHWTLHAIFIFCKLVEHILRNIDLGNLPNFYLTHNELKIRQMQTFFFFFIRLGRPFMETEPIGG